jgi:hypothetical protein
VQQAATSGPWRLPQTSTAPELELALDEVAPPVPIIGPPHTSLSGTQSWTCWPSALVMGTHERPAGQSVAEQSGAQYVSPPNCPHLASAAQSVSVRHGGHAAGPPPEPPDADVAADEGWWVSPDEQAQ